MCWPCCTLQGIVRFLEPIEIIRRCDTRFHDCAWETIPIPRLVYGTRQRHQPCMVALSRHNDCDLQRLLALVRRNDMFESCANLCHFGPANLRVLSLANTVAVVKNPLWLGFLSLMVC